MQIWYRLQQILYVWYEQIQAQALRAKTLFADETGWRVKGKTWWLWCFTTSDLTGDWRFEAPRNFWIFLSEATGDGYHYCWLSHMVCGRVVHESRRLSFLRVAEARGVLG